MIEVLDRTHIKITCDVCGIESTKELAFEIPEDYQIAKAHSEKLQACQTCIESGRAEAYRKGYESAKKEDGKWTQ